MAGVSQFYFAWSFSSATDFTEEFVREDELIFSFSLVHDEGQFATLDLEIRNPRIGLLNPERPLWAWFSWSDADTFKVLFHGRIVGIPTDLFAEVITITLVGKSADYIDQRQAVADSLNVLPFVDPIFIDSTLQSDPNTVLEAYSALWHVDRIDGQVTTSDVIVGEDGLDEFTSDEVFYDSVKVKIGQSPLTQINITATASWHQTGDGAVDIGTTTFVSYTSGLLSDWPKVGEDLQSGYSVIASSLVEFSDPVIDLTSSQAGSDAAAAAAAAAAGGDSIDAGTAIAQAAIAAASKAGEIGGAASTTSQTPVNVSWSYQNTAKTHSDGDTMSVQGTASGIQAGQHTNVVQTSVVGDAFSGTAASASISYDIVGRVAATPAAPVSTPNPANPDSTTTTPTTPDDVPPGAITYTASLMLGMLMDQQRMETVKITVTSDLQPMLTEPDEKSVVESLTFNVSDVVAAGATDESAGAYFATDRGTQSLEYMLLIARAHLLANSRAIQVSWDCSFPRVLDMSCRMNAALFDNRLPGGSVLGKVTSYGMDGDGDKGQFTGHVTISSAIGNGNAVMIDDGTGDYVEEGYESDYQYYTGSLTVIGTGDLSFGLPLYPVVGLQNPLSPDQVLLSIQWFSDSINDPYVQIELLPLTGISTSVEYDITTNPLVVPLQINLAATSTAE
jgi:hypothetical protein